MQAELHATKASSTELYEAFYTMVVDEMRAQGAETINLIQAQAIAKTLTYDLAIQDRLLSAVQKAI